MMLEVILSGAVTYLILRTQHLLSLNPQGMDGLSHHLAFNTAVSFTTNTNWQSYGGENTMPIVVLSARDREAEKIEALDLGADDYVNKPVGVGELLARLRAALRHRMQHAGETSVFRAGPLTVDVPAHRVVLDGAEVRLTPREFGLLALLVQNAGKVVTHRQLLTAVWGPAHADDTQYLRVYIGQLREKLEPNADEPRFIVTEPGVGHRLRAE